ncbi:MAG: GH3 auxin-responsive promoter family protein [Cyclobacteriaceae bacterium]|nr:GH3 auxin-responsive promoter family protein [Cyclobacteriaceae bacterium]
MAIIGSLLKRGITLRESLEQQFSSAIDLQKQELQKLLIKARNTRFGKTYNFIDILKSFRTEPGNGYYEQFKANVPIHDYDSMYDNWWVHAREGEEDVCWPGRIKYFALSSGTSGATSKYIPITKDIFKSIKKTSVRQILSLANYDLPPEFFSKKILMLGGSTSLTKSGQFFQGDLSGITASQMPFWMQFHYKPGKKIAAEVDWNNKLEHMTQKAKDWDIGIIVGVPSWIQLLFEKIIAHYNLKTIHDIWPNLYVFVHGGVAYTPYKASFEKLLARPLINMETYLASEGYLAFQAYNNHGGMRLILNGGIFFEFIPFTGANFDEDGRLKSNPEVLSIAEIKENTDYAILISTNAGSWRYLIGDVIQFINVRESEIKIVGRTKQFLSICGEHLSVDNMNQAIVTTARELGIEIPEFTVAAYPKGAYFVHHWYLGTDAVVDTEKVKKMLDEHLKTLNDDYTTERTSVLKYLELEAYPTSIFYGWMASNGKIGGQNKFPRVLKNEKFESWKLYLSSLTQ